MGESSHRLKGYRPNWLFGKGRREERGRGRGKKKKKAAIELTGQLRAKSKARRQASLYFRHREK